MVVERRRPPGEREHVIFYCDNCGALVEDIDFDCGDIVEHFSQAMLDFGTMIRGVLQEVRQKSPAA